MNYDVHIYSVFRLKVQKVEAESQIDAIKEAVEKADMYAFDTDEFSWSEEPPFYYLVDEAGDEEYDNSRWYDDPDVFPENYPDHGVRDNFHAAELLMRAVELYGQAGDEQNSRDEYHRLVREARKIITNEVVLYLRRRISNELPRIG